MTKRRKRVFDEAQRQALLNAIGECRRACITARSNAPIDGNVYTATGAVCESIDNLAEILTGDRTHFHLKQHSSASYQPSRKG